LKFSKPTSTQSTTTTTSCGENPLSNNVLGSFVCNETDGTWIYYGNVIVRNNTTNLTNDSYSVGNIVITTSTVFFTNTSLIATTATVVSSNVSFDGNFNILDNLTIVNSVVHVKVGSNISVDGCMLLNNTNLVLHVDVNNVDKSKKNVILTYNCTFGLQFNQVTVVTNDVCQTATVSTNYETNQLNAIISLVSTQACAGTSRVDPLIHFNFMLLLIVLYFFSK